MQALATATDITFKNILFLTDFSEASEGALAYAQGLARHYGAHLYPAHACDPVVLAETPASDIISQLVEASRQQLVNLAKDKNINGTPLFAEGNIEAAFPRWIAEHGIDLVVVGTQGKRGVRHFLLGSTAEYVCRNTQCPVLTVGPHVNFRPRKGFSAENILFPTNLGAHTEFASTYAFSFARETGGHVTLMHVVPLEPQFQTDTAGVVAQATKKLEELLPSDAKAWCDPEIKVEIGDPAEKLLDRANKDRPDLIVLGLPYNKRFAPHHRAGVAYRIVSGAPCPVLTVRAPATE